VADKSDAEARTARLSFLGLLCVLCEQHIDVLYSKRIVEAGILPVCVAIMHEDPPAELAYDELLQLCMELLTNVLQKLYGLHPFLSAGVLLPHLFSALQRDRSNRPFNQAVVYSSPNTAVGAATHDQSACDPSFLRRQPFAPQKAHRNRAQYLCHQWRPSMPSIRIRCALSRPFCAAVIFCASSASAVAGLVCASVPLPGPVRIPVTRTLTTTWPHSMACLKERTRFALLASPSMA
jgi:hypothetical protein